MFKKISLVLIIYLMTINVLTAADKHTGFDVYGLGATTCEKWKGQDAILKFSTYQWIKGYLNATNHYIAIKKLPYIRLDLFNRDFFDKKIIAYCDIEENSQNHIFEVIDSITSGLPLSK